MFETRKGARPNRAVWFAVTRFSLDWLPGMDVWQNAYLRGLLRVLGAPILPARPPTSPDQKGERGTPLIWLYPIPVLQKH